MSGWNSREELPLGPVTVTWKANKGRFVITGFNIHAWNYDVDILHPIGIISQPLANVWDLYKDGIALKLQQMHRGHAVYDKANAKIRRALRMLELLRDAPQPHFSDAEFIFLVAAMQSSLVLSAMVPVGNTPAEQVFNTSTKVDG